jgi:hypothetical protein
MKEPLCYLILLLFIAINTIALGNDSLKTKVATERPFSNVDDSLPHAKVLEEVEGIIHPRNVFPVPFHMNASKEKDRLFLIKYNVFGEDTACIKIFDFVNDSVYKIREISIESVQIDFERVHVYGDSLVIFPRSILGRAKIYNLGADSIVSSKTSFGKGWRFDLYGDELQNRTRNDPSSRNYFRKLSEIETKNFTVVWDEKSIRYRKK